MECPVGKKECDWLDFDTPEEMYCDHPGIAKRLKDNHLEYKGYYSIMPIKYMMKWNSLIYEPCPP